MKKKELSYYHIPPQHRKEELTRQYLSLHSERHKHKANPIHLEILMQGVDAWNKWRTVCSDVKPDLVRANLSKANLKGVDLRETNLERARLDEANLENANLEMANLNMARLEGANLNGANLKAAILIGAVLAAEKPSNMSANLTNSDLRDIKLTPKGELVRAGSFLDLASCLGLETARFSNPDFLESYLTMAFEYAHRIKIPEKKRWPNFVAQTIRNIKALQSIYASALEPGESKEIISIITTELVEYLKRHPETLYQIRPRQFEVLVAEILSSYDWEVQLTPVAKDGGYDIFAISKERPHGVKTSWIIECKKYARENKVGVAIVRQLYAVKSNLKVANALLATTSFFTKGAIQFKASRYDIELKDYPGLLEWINEYSPNPEGKLYLKKDRLIIPGED